MMQYYCGNASQTLFCDGVSGSLGDVPGGEAKALLQIILGADFAVLILYGHISHGGGLPNGEYLGNGGEQTVHAVVVFAGYHRAALLRILNHQRLIQRLDGEHIDHRGLDALFCQSGGSQRLGDHDAAGDDGHVRALAQHDALADFKFFALGVYRGAGLAAHAQIFHAGNIRQLGSTFCSIAPSVTSMMVAVGMTRYSATSSKGMWVLPLKVAHTPGSLPITVMSLWA